MTDATSTTPLNPGGQLEESQVRHKEHVDDLTMLQSRMTTYFQTGDHAQALSLARQIAARHPQRADSWRTLGAVQQSLNQWEDALTSYQKAVSLAPDDANVHCLYGDMLLRTEKYNEAYRAFARSVQIDPRHIRAGRVVVSMLVSSHRPKEAWAILQQLIPLSPGVLDLRLDAVRIALRLGELQIARLHASEAILLAPDQAAVHHVLGLLRMRTGDLPAAISSFRDMLRLLQADAEFPRRDAVSTSYPFDYQAYEVLMWTTVAQLAQAGVHAFPTAGTLLGLMRDGHLLPFDKDVDVGLPFEEMGRAVAFLLANGWVELDPNAGLINPRAVRHPASGLLMDLCGYHTDKGAEISTGGLWMEGVPMAWNRVVEFPVLSLHVTERPEGRVWALDQPETWLEALYGDWRTPDPDFDTIIAAHNLRGFALLTQCYTLLRLAEQLRDGKLRKARASARVWLRHFPDDAQILQIASQVDTALA
ncbi:tetratricopeptide repeat protein [Pigmentiphaga aceris]|uniref:Tetratricopeptide repeat protein n=1 Tax=Pigmentiphaga aceris TaxID=1940612 RepID=A0A5C0B4V4_9BURK|nr:tetratricopeptide repeat protein [Pigmentiphaga aceris]QEI08663.1 tetratricopeptide repeat protein [Pigmentiphaga aceris]